MQARTRADHHGRAPLPGLCDSVVCDHIASGLLDGMMWVSTWDSRYITAIRVGDIDMTKRSNDVDVVDQTRTANWRVVRRPPAEVDGDCVGTCIGLVVCRIGGHLRRSRKDGTPARFRGEVGRPNDV
jgi:hypothetical protein